MRGSIGFSTRRASTGILAASAVAKKAMPEEPVAELGSAFLSADLGLTPEPSADHAGYVAS
jgi:antirestriction protein ArdC